jgi:hypothetical protein
LAESKNASVVRKLFGYAHIPQRWAPLINEFNHSTLFPLCQSALWLKLLKNLTDLGY